MGCVCDDTINKIIFQVNKTLYIYKVCFYEKANHLFNRRGTNNTSQSKTVSKHDESRVDKTFKFELGCERTLRVLESKNSEEETIIDVRLFADDQPTEKGQAMTLSRWRILCDNVDQIDQKLEEVKRDEKVDYRLHLRACVHYIPIQVCEH